MTRGYVTKVKAGLMELCSDRSHLSYATSAKVMMIGCWSSISGAARKSCRHDRSSWRRSRITDGRLSGQANRTATADRIGSIWRQTKNGYCPRRRRWFFGRGDGHNRASNRNDAKNRATMPAIDGFEAWIGKGTLQYPLGERTRLACAPRIRSPHQFILIPITCSRPPDLCDIAR